MRSCGGAARVPRQRARHRGHRRGGGGAQALELLASVDAEGRRPDVIVMDLQMARSTGSSRPGGSAPSTATSKSWRSRRSPRRSACTLRSRRGRRATCSRTPTRTTSLPRSGPRTEASSSSIRVIAERLMSSLRERRGDDPPPNSPPGSSTCFGSWRRASRTSRSPRSSRSASGPRGPTYRGSSASSASARGHRRLWGGPRGARGGRARGPLTFKKHPRSVERPLYGYRGGGGRDERSCRFTSR